MKKLVNKRKARDVCIREIDKQECFVAKHARALERYQERLEANRAKRGPLIKEVEELEATLTTPTKKIKVKKTK